jgi:hypothetical protein
MARWSIWSTSTFLGGAKPLKKRASHSQCGASIAGLASSGGLFLNALLRERRAMSSHDKRLPVYSKCTLKRTFDLPRRFNRYLEHTSFLASALKALGLSDDVPVITRDQVQYAKPDPDLFLAATKRLNVPIETSTVVGDSVWDLLAARRAHALGVGLLSGGYGQDELERAGAYRVYQDPMDLLRHIDEVGVRNPITARSRTK